MGDLPLRTPTHRRLGGPLPRQLANAPHAHPPPLDCFPPREMPPQGLRGISRDFSRLSPCGGQVAYVLLTRAPVAGGSQQADCPAAPRLACVKPVASVHPEPGSNSSLLYILFSFFLVLRPWRFAPDFSGPLPPRYTRIALIRSDALYCSLLFLYLFRIFKISSGNRRKLLF